MRLSYKRWRKYDVMRRKLGPFLGDNMKVIFFRRKLVSVDSPLDTVLYTAKNMVFPKSFTYFNIDIYGYILMQSKCLCRKKNAIGMESTGVD